MGLTSCRIRTNGKTSWSGQAALRIVDNGLQKGKRCQVYLMLDFWCRRFFGRPGGKLEFRRPSRAPILAPKLLGEENRPDIFSREKTNLTPFRGQVTLVQLGTGSGGLDTGAGAICQYYLNEKQAEIAAEVATLYKQRAAIAAEFAALMEYLSE